MVRNSDFEIRIARVVPPPTITQASLSPLERQVDQLLLGSPTPECIEFDFSLMESIESTGLNWLLDLNSRLGEQNVQMVVREPSSIMRDVLVATRLDQRLRVLPPLNGEAENA